MKSRIKQLAKERGMSFRELARRAGISDCAIAKWGHVGLDNARFGLMARVAKALEVPMEDLYEQ